MSWIKEITSLHLFRDSLIKTKNLLIHIKFLVSGIKTLRINYETFDITH